MKKLFKRICFMAFMLSCAAVGKGLVNYYYPKDKVTAPTVVTEYNWKSLLDLGLNKTGQFITTSNVNIDGEMVSATSIMYKDYSGVATYNLKTGAIKIPYTMEIVGNKVTYHYNYQGKKWDYVTTVKELIKSI